MLAIRTPHIKLRLRFSLMVLLLWGKAVCAQTFIVNTTTDTVDQTPGNSVCADINGKCSLRAAIMEANAQSGSNDTINLDRAIYTLSINNTSGSEDTGIEDDLDITDNLTLQGLGAGKTFIDGNKLDRVFHILNNTTATFNNLTIRNGKSGGDGGGTKISGNSTGTFNNVTISGNKAANGGGIDITSGSTAIIKNSVISGNKGFYAGGIQVNSSGELRLENSTLSQNNASGGGGGIYITTNYAVATIINSTISGNTAGTGGGLYTISANLKISGSTITNNQSNYTGGGYFNLNPNLVIKNSILAKNNARNGPDCNGSPAISQGYNLIGNSSGCSISYTTGDLVGDSTNPIDPMIDSLKDNGGASLTHALLPNSPALDAGNPLTPGSGGSACNLSDQRGASRIGRGVCDIGAFEASGGGDLWVNIINTPNTEPTRQLIQQTIIVGNKGPNKVSTLKLSLTLPVGSQKITILSNTWSCTTSSNISTCVNKFLNTQTETTLTLGFIPPITGKSLITQANAFTVSADPIPDNNQVNFKTIINKAPIVITQNTINYEKGNVTVSVSPNANIIDEDDTILASANIQITRGYRLGEDELYWSGNARIIAQWIPETATLTLTGNDAIDNYKQALREIIYDNRTETSIDTGQRSISITVSDAYDKSKPVFINLVKKENGTSSNSSSEDNELNGTNNLFDDTEDGIISNLVPKQQIKISKNTKILSDKRIWEHNFPPEEKEITEDRKNASQEESQHIISTIKYDDEWVSIEQIEAQQKEMSDEFVFAGTASLFLAGIAHFYLRALSFLGVFFSSPLLIPFDPLPVLMISNNERQRRKRITEKEINVENSVKDIGTLLDDDPKDNN